MRIARGVPSAQTFLLSLPLCPQRLCGSLPKRGFNSDYYSVALSGPRVADGQLMGNFEIERESTR